MALLTASPVGLEGAPAPKRRRSLAALVAEQFAQGITAEKIALSLAVGSFCAFCPVLGAATPLCLAVAAVLRLNQPIVQIVNWGILPIYFPFVYGFVRLGDVILGKSRPHPDSMPMVHHIGSLFGHALLGWAVLAPFWVLAGYHASLPVLRAAAAARARRKS